jgi:aspartyl aminopeptidase
LQTTELGRIDEGGGGTVAKFLARRGVHVVDVGAAVVSMHSPFELSHKHDLIWALRGFRAFLRDGATEAVVMRGE